jgi:XTP/dITP diphosphohydrolase
MELILATRNAHKLREVQRMLAPYRISVAPLPDDVVLPPEDGESFEENAWPKARAAALALGRAAIADDSGIEAAAIGGRPGVRSARFAGEHATDSENLAKLLAEAPAGSGLRYVCALAFVDPGDAGAASPAAAAAGAQERVFFGECTGRLAPEARGERGFGYDPVFLPDDGTPGLTMAELGDEAKDAISHRGRALRAFAQWFTTEYPGAGRPGPLP